MRGSFVEFLELRNDCVCVHESVSRLVSKMRGSVARWGGGRRSDSRWRSRSAGCVVLMALTTSSMLGTLAELLPADMLRWGRGRGERADLVKLTFAR